MPHTSLPKDHHHHPSASTTAMATNERERARVASLQSSQIPCVGHTGRERQEEDEREHVDPECGQERAPRGWAGLRSGAACYGGTAHPELTEIVSGESEEKREQEGEGTRQSLTVTSSTGRRCGAAWALLLLQHGPACADWCGTVSPCG